MSMYHEGQRALQDRFDGRRLSDVLEAHRRHDVFTDADVEMIRTAPFFFLASAHGDCVDCSIKGGNPGFVRITGPGTLEFPDYDGNSMYRSLGNILRSPAVGLLFVRFDGSSTKLRIMARSWWYASPRSTSIRTVRATCLTCRRSSCRSTHRSPAAPRRRRNGKAASTSSRLSRPTGRSGTSERRHHT